MSFATFVAVIVALAVLVVLALAAMKPNVFRVARLVRIKAPPQILYPYVADFHRWIEWSPYDARDAGLKRTYDGEPSGVGAAYGWEGAKLGTGRMRIVEAAPPRHIAIDLMVVRPFKARNTAEFTFELLNDPDLGHCTAVTWSMHGPVSFMSKVMGVFIDMDRMIGKDFEKGLLALKGLAEA
jgi:hypothetical protein